MQQIKNAVRRATIKTLRIFNPGDISIRHHWTGDRLRLHTFHHKGYWWHGKKRELASMSCCAGLISKGQTVVECGGHIGYLSMFFASLVGDSGSVIVFEPALSNLAYLRINAQQRESIRIEELAVGPSECVANMYVDNFTGQNNSLLANYSNVEQNSLSAGIEIQTEATRVNVVDLDGYCRRHNVLPDFVKMDIEGYEFEALKGMTSLLADVRPLLMIEVTEQSGQVYELLTQAGYKGYSEERNRIADIDSMPRGNSFWFHPDHHATQLRWMESQVAA